MKRVGFFAWTVLVAAFVVTCAIYLVGYIFIPEEVDYYLDDFGDTFFAMMVCCSWPMALLAWFRCLFFKRTSPGTGGAVYCLCNVSAFSLVWLIVFHAIDSPSDVSSGMAAIIYASDVAIFGLLAWLGHVFFRGCIWYRKIKAAEGDAAEQFYVGLCCFNGDGVRRDYAEASKWLAKAAEQGRKDAVQWILKAAQQGSGKAQYALGLCLIRGWGCNRDHEQGVEWVRRAAEQGVAEAIMMIGRLK